MPLLRAFLSAGLVIGTVAFVGCGSTPEPEPATPTPEPPPPPPPPPPDKAPECKSLEEKCRSNADTQARVAHADLVFIPPNGWIYAQEPELTIAQTQEGGAALAITAYESASNDKRDVAIDQLAGATGIKLPEKGRKKVVPNWKKPDGEVKVGEMTLQMWQFDGALRGSKSGPVLFFAARNGEQALIGIGFAPTGESSDQEIMKSLETIGPAPVGDGGSTK